ncbi:unnamed protein product, partial [Ectocarpus fasciculatus]
GNRTSLAGGNPIAPDQTSMPPPPFSSTPSTNNPVHPQNTRSFHALRGATAGATLASTDELYPPGVSVRHAQQVRLPAVAPALLLLGLRTVLTAAAAAGMMVPTADVHGAGAGHLWLERQELQ